MNVSNRALRHTIIHLLDGFRIHVRSRNVEAYGEVRASDDGDRFQVWDNGQLQAAYYTDDVAEIWL